jgi:hypothetical protein
MDSIANVRHLEYLWGDQFHGREKYIVRGSDGRTMPLFKAGVYFLWNQSGLQYIGQSHFILLRITSKHPVVRGDLHRWIIGVIPVEDNKERLRLESYCIKLFCPPMNNVHTPGYSARGRRRRK